MDHACSRPPLHRSAPRARFVGDPVDVVTGAVVGIDREFQLPGPFQLLWRRYYDSRRHLEDAGCGLGFRFEYDRRLIQDLDGLCYVAPDGGETRMPYLERDGEVWQGLGFTLVRVDELRFELSGGDRVTMCFAFPDPALPAKLLRLYTREHAVSFGYDGHGRLHTIADALGRALSVRWDALSRMQRVLLTDPTCDLTDKVAAEYEYDDAGRLVRTTDPYGHHLGYAYDKRGRLARFTDRNGYSFHYVYDDHGRCIHTRGDDGVEELRLSYDRDARMTTATRGNGGQWQYFYDDNDALISVIDPNGGVTEYQYDPSGTPRKTIRADKTELTHELDETGFNYVDALPTGQGVSPGANLDPFDFYSRRYRIHRAPVVAHRPHGYRPRTAAEWELGELLDEPFALPVKDTRPRFVSPEEHAALVVADEPGKGLHREVRDAFGLLVRIERDDGPSRQYHYDPNGNVTRITDFDGGITRFQIESWNHVVADADALQHDEAYAYDSDENLTMLRDAGGARTDLRYDKTRNVTEVHRHGRLRERYSYDIAGKPIERLAPDGRTLLRFAYDAEQLLQTRALGSGEAQVFEYGNLGALAKCSSDAGEVELRPTIDGGFRRADLRDGKGLTHELTWGRVDTTTILERFPLQYYEFKDGSTQMVVAPGERVHRIRLCGSGVVRKELADGSRETIQYDPRGRVIARLRADKAGRARDTHYQYSGEGDLVRVIDSERGLARYEYDAAHRLIRVHPPGNAPPDDYGYDAAGNLVQKPGITHADAPATEGDAESDPAMPRLHRGLWLESGNRVHRLHDDYFFYDDRDHLSERRGPAGNTRYVHDDLDRLIEIDLPDGTSWSAKYDALGRRTEKKHGGDTWTYYWNGDRLAAEVLPDGKVRIYLYADRDQALQPFGFCELASESADPATAKHFRFVCDHLGAPEQVVDEEGTVVWQADLEPFGTAKVTLGEGFHQPIRWPGHYCDAETGLHYNRYRYYSPELGRYLQSDPVDLEGGHNLYAYAQDSNPLRDVDLFGLACARAEALRAQAEDRGLINDDGSPGKPLNDMTSEEQQLFCAARAAQLEDHTGGSARSTTVCVMIVNGPVPMGRRVVVTSNHDSGLPPASVRRNMRSDEEPRQTYPVVKNSHRDDDGNVHRNPQAETNRQTVGNRDGAVVAVDRDGNASNMQKRNANNEGGTTEHHAEQRAQNSLGPGETAEAMSPSRPCCEGCHAALSNSGNIDNVPPSMRVR